MLTPLTTAKLDLQAYARVLGAFHGYFADLEPALRALVTPLIEECGTTYRYLPRTDLLYRDLHDLGAGMSVERARPDCILPVPGLESADHVLGTLYVLEGATQGGRIIAPRVNRELGFDASRGAWYFHLYADRQLPSFRALVSSREARHDPERVANGARLAFVTLQAHLDAWLNATRRS